MRSKGWDGDPLLRTCFPETAVRSEGSRTGKGELLRMWFQLKSSLSQILRSHTAQPEPPAWWSQWASVMESVKPRCSTDIKHAPEIKILNEQNLVHCPELINSLKMLHTAKMTFWMLGDKYISLIPFHLFFSYVAIRNFKIHKWLTVYFN